MSSEASKRNPFRFFLTLRARLFVWNTVVILFLAAVMLFGLREGMLYSLIREEDQLLREDIEEVKLFINSSNPINWNKVAEAIEQKAEGHAPRHWFCVIQDDNSNILAKTQSSPQINVHLPLTSEFRAGNSGDFRYGQLTLTLNGHKNESYLVRVGSSLDEVKEDVSRVTSVAMIAGLFLLVVAPVGGYVLARRATDPLHQINQATARLRPSRLDERLVDRKTGDELDQLAITINGLLDRIADHLARHRDLVANAAHELRSPLAAIRSTAEVALNQDRSVEDYKELLSVVIEEASRLGTLVQQLLLLAESDAHRLEHKQEPVDVGRLVRRCADMFEGVVDSKGIRLKTEIETATVRGDADHLRQVILNLLDNATKFTKAGGEIRLRVWKHANEVIIEVADTGIGIPEVHQQRVFERFYRADKSRERSPSGGTGLGLSICQAIIDAHGGTIHLSSTPGEGTSIWIHLPDYNSNADA